MCGHINRRGVGAKFSKCFLDKIMKSRTLKKKDKNALFVCLLYRPMTQPFPIFTKTSREIEHFQKMCKTTGEMFKRRLLIFQIV